MIVDGGGTTEIAVYCLGGIVCDKSVKLLVMFLPMISYITCVQHNLLLEKVPLKNKNSNWCRYRRSRNSSRGYVCSRDLLTGKPKQVEVSYRNCKLDKSIQRIEDAYGNFISNTTRISCRHLQWNLPCRWRIYVERS
jgi:rod shape-determining protein MreB